MLALRGAPQEVAFHLAVQGFGHVERQIVATSFVRSGFTGHFSAEKARRNGWQKLWNSDRWFPVEEPLPRLPGSPVQSEVTITLRSIMYGWINLLVESRGLRLDLSICELGDSLVSLARFVGILVAGGAPHAALANRATSHWIVQDHDIPGRCRFYLNVSQEQQHCAIDAVVEREQLVTQFRNLTAAIADHPHLAHQFLCWGQHSDAYEKEADAAEFEWRRGIHEGRYPDDHEAWERFELEWIAARVPLLVESRKYADRYKAMLRTLEIPKEWLETSGC